MAGIVMPLDMLEIHRLGHAWPLIHLPQPVRQICIVGNSPQVAFEVAVVHRIKTNQRSEQPHIGFGQVLAGQIAMAAQVLFQMIQLGKHIIKRTFIRLL